MKFVEDIRDLIGKNEQKEMRLEGKTLEGSNFDDLLRNIYVQNSKYNLTGIHYFFQALEG